jgi:hypothetical protein
MRAKELERNGMKTVSSLMCVCVHLCYASALLRRLCLLGIWLFKRHGDEERFVRYIFL